jgi:hypothetical protein
MLPRPNWFPERALRQGCGPRAAQGSLPSSLHNLRACPRPKRRCLENSNFVNYLLSQIGGAVRFLDPSATQPRGLCTPISTTCQRSFHANADNARPKWHEDAGVTLSISSAPASSNPFTEEHRSAIVRVISSIHLAKHCGRPIKPGRQAIAAHVWKTRTGLQFRCTTRPSLEFIA